MVLGGNGADTIFGGGGHDVLSGGSGNDRLDGGTNADLMKGGAGNDSYVVDNAGDVVDESVASSNGTDLVRSSLSFNLGDATHAKGNAENLTLVGSAAINATGNSLANILTGNAANNTLYGRGGADTMIGGGGNDRLVGGPGNDRLTGGPGADHFVFNTDTLSNSDRITDFSPSTPGELINLSLLRGPALHFLGTHAFTDFVGEVRIKDIAGPDVIVQVDLDHDAAPEMEIRLSHLSAAALHASDFLL